MADPIQSTLRKQALRVGFLLCLNLTLFAAAELFARLTGNEPWAPSAGGLDQKIEPGGTFFAPHPTLGYALIPGKFTLRKPNASWHPTHRDALHREMAEGSSNASGDRPGVWVFGDSYTYGWGVEDEETYPARLQQAHPELAVVNFGIGGYSTLQMLIQFEDALATTSKSPEVAIVAYSSFHDGRNALLRGNRKSWIPSADRFPLFPAAWIEDGELKHSMQRLEYTPWPLEERSALVNIAEENYNKLQVLTSGAQAVSKALLLRFRDLCKSRGIRLVIAGIFPNSRTASVLQWAKSQGIEAIDIAVDHGNPENLTSNHPNAHANVQYAKKLEAALASAPGAR